MSKGPPCLWLCRDAPHNSTPTAPSRRLLHVLRTSCVGRRPRYGRSAPRHPGVPGTDLRVGRQVGSRAPPLWPGRHELNPGLVGRHSPGLGSFVPARISIGSAAATSFPGLQRWRARCVLLTSAPRSVLPSCARPAVLWRPTCQPASQPACTARINAIKTRAPKAISPASAFCHPPCLPRCQVPGATVADRTRRPQQRLATRGGWQSEPSWHRQRTAAHGTAYHVVATSTVLQCRVGGPPPLWLSHAVAATLISARLPTWAVGTAANGARGAILHPGDVAGPQPHPPPQELHFREAWPGPEVPVQTGIGAGWACHRGPLFQNQPFLA